MFDLSSGILFSEGEPYDHFEESDTPVSVWQAVEMCRLTEPDYWGHIARDVFKVEGDHLGPMMVMDKIIETGSVDQLHAPMRVYIDSHYYVTVYE